jgi:hypothetical protein
MMMHSGGAGTPSWISGLASALASNNMRRHSAQQIAEHNREVLTLWCQQRRDFFRIGQPQLG